MEPSGSDAVPAIVVLLVGRVITLSVPAFTTGVLLYGDKFTVTLTLSTEMAPSSSFTVSRNLYTPGTRPVSAVTVLVGNASTGPVGPKTCFHAILVMDPSVSVAVPL